MKKRTSHKNVRKQNKSGVVRADGPWVYSGSFTFGDINGDDTIYFDNNATTITLPEGTFSGFQAGDIITITNNASDSIKKKRKVHVARRYRKEKQETHTITNVSETSMTITMNELYSYCSEEWS